MKNVSHKKIWRTTAIQIHMDPPLILLIKINYDTKAEKDCVKIKLCKDPTLENPDMYEFKISLFDNGKLEEFLLFVHNLKMAIDAPGTLTYNVKLWYICTLLL